MDTPKRLKISISEADLEEFEAVETADWEEGVSLSHLVDWINMVADRYRPENFDARASDRLTERSFRHYQTLGCIDPPKRVGRKAQYGFRQYLQALLVRKLIWEGVPSDKIARSMKGKTNQDYKAMLFADVDIVPGGLPGEGVQLEVPRPQNWRRHTVLAGVELHIEANRGAMSRKEIEMVIREVERLLES